MKRGTEMVRSSRSRSVGPIQLSRAVRKGGKHGRPAYECELVMVRIEVRRTPHLGDNSWVLSGEHVLQTASLCPTPPSRAVALSSYYVGGVVGPHLVQCTLVTNMRDAFELRVVRQPTRSNF